MVSCPATKTKAQSSLASFSLSRPRLPHPGDVPADGVALLAVEPLHGVLQVREELEGALLVGAGALGVAGEPAEVAEGLVGPEFHLVEVLGRHVQQGADGGHAERDRIVVHGVAAAGSEHRGQVLFGVLADPVLEAGDGLRDEGLGNDLAQPGVVRGVEQGEEGQRNGVHHLGGEDLRGPHGPADVVVPGDEPDIRHGRVGPQHGGVFPHPFIVCVGIALRSVIDDLERRHSLGPAQFMRIRGQLCAFAAASARGYRGCFCHGGRHHRPSFRINRRDLRLNSQCRAQQLPPYRTSVHRLRKSLVTDTPWGYISGVVSEVVCPGRAPSPSQPFNPSTHPSLRNGRHAGTTQAPPPAAHRPFRGHRHRTPPSRPHGGTTTTMTTWCTATASTPGTAPPCSRTGSG